MKRFFFLLACISLCACTVRSDPGQGKKIGKIVKLSKQGMLWKTWEGELIRGGFSDGTGIMGGSFHFTIEDGNLAQCAEKFFEDQSEVILEYRVEFISSICRAESYQPNFAVSIKKNDSHR